MSRTINFGSETALEVEVLGYELEGTETVSRDVARIVESTEGVVDVNVVRDANYPQFRADGGPQEVRRGGPVPA